MLVLAFTVGSYEVPFLLGRPFPATLPVVAYQQFRDPDLAARPLAMAIACSPPRWSGCARWRTCRWSPGCGPRSRRR